jgi:glycosyltransferase involved in cell wall biosynthesis
MRILMLAQSYPPTTGGEQHHVRNLSIELVTRGHDVTVATLWREDMPAFEYDQGVRVHRIHGSVQHVPALFTNKELRHLPPLPDPQVLCALRRIILHERPDIVHAHNWMVHSFTPLKTWSKAKLILTLHDYSLICATQRFMYQGVPCNGPGWTKCLRCAAQHYGIARGVPITLANWVGGKIEHHIVDMFLPVSQAVAEATQLLKHGLPYRVIPNFIPDELDVSGNDADPLLAQLPKDNYLLFVGDRGREKGVEVLFRAYTQMGSQVPLVLIGREVAGFPSTCPPNVLVLPGWPHASVMRAWSRCTIALIPSIWIEPFGIVAIEAMAMGRPVVASRIGGLPDIVADGETGFLVTPGDERALQAAIERLLADPALREHMGARARQRVVQFQASTVVPRIEQVYQEVLRT